MKKARTEIGASKHKRKVALKRSTFERHLIRAAREAEAYARGELTDLRTSVRAST